MTFDRAGGEDGRTLIQAINSILNKIGRSSKISYNKLHIYKIDSPLGPIST